MSGLDFLLLVLQNSYSFVHNAFFNFSSVYFFLNTSSVVNWCTYGPCLSWVFWSRPGVIFFRLKSSIGFHVENHFFGRSLNFCKLPLKWWGFEIAPTCCSPARISDHAMTSQDYKKNEHVRACLFSSSLQISNSFNLTAFFQFFYVFFFLVTKHIFNCCSQGPCVSWGWLLWAKSVFFSRLKSSNRFFEKLMFSKGPSILVNFVCNDGGFDFAPACGSPASVSDLIMTSQDYLKFEHVTVCLHSLILPGYKVHLQLLHLKAISFSGLFSPD